MGDLTNKNIKILMRTGYAHALTYAAILSNLLAANKLTDIFHLNFVCRIITVANYPV